MPSPFPGMDPYLEDPAFWPDFHDAFIVYWRDALNERLPENYEARVNERTRIIDLSADPVGGLLPRPDVAIHRGTETQTVYKEPAGVATLEPVTIPQVFFEESRETYLEIRRRPERTVVTVLELLSPSNKSGTDRVLYLDKRNALMHQDVHVVELDLLLGGRRIPMQRPLPPGDYYMFVSHCERRRDCDVYAWSVRQPLPTLPIPLRSPDPAVLIDLGAVFTTAYDRGRYARSLAYAGPPPADLREVDQEWAAGLVKPQS